MNQDMRLSSNRLRTLDEVMQIVRELDFQAWHRWECHNSSSIRSLSGRRLEVLQTAQSYLLNHCNTDIDTFTAFVSSVEPHQLWKLMGKKGKLTSTLITMDLRTFLMYVYDICTGNATGSEWVAFLH